MRRFFVDPRDLADHSSIILKGEEFHHLKNVCRLEEGERVELLDGEGKIAIARIELIDKKSAKLKVENIERVTELARPHVKIVLCVPRFQKVDLIVQKCAELGAHSVIPVTSDRSFVKSLSKDLEKKTVRWQKISSEACKQSGRAWPMSVTPFSTLEKEISATDSAQGLFLYEGEGGAPLKAALEPLRSAGEIKVFIGGEGGFSVREADLFRSRGMSPVTLGDLVLRVETACIAILSIIQYDLGLMR